MITWHRVTITTRNQHEFWSLCVKLLCRETITLLAMLKLVPTIGQQNINLMIINNVKKSQWLGLTQLSVTHCGFRTRTWLQIVFFPSAWGLFKCLVNSSYHLLWGKTMIFCNNIPSEAAIYLSRIVDDYNFYFYFWNPRKKLGHTWSCLKKMVMNLPWCDMMMVVSEFSHHLINHSVSTILSPNCPQQHVWEIVACGQMTSVEVSCMRVFHKTKLK